MISIAKALNQIIHESPFLEDALYHEYLNLSSFASYIHPRVEQITKKQVSLWSIKMALTKYTVEKQDSISYQHFSANDCFIKKHISIVYLDKTSDLVSSLQQIHISKNTHSYFASIVWEREIALIFDESMSEEIHRCIQYSQIKLKLENLSLIWIFLDEEKLNEIGTIYTLTKKLNFHAVNIIEIISNYTEISFIVASEDFQKSIEVLIWEI